MHLRSLCSKFPGNDRSENVLLKVVAINSLYATRIMAVRSVAEHIRQLHIDTKVNLGSPKLVSEIGNVKLGEKEKLFFFYSFATKYCSWHKPDAYPIYDKYVAYLLWEYQQSSDFRFDNFERRDLIDYLKFKEIIERFRGFYGLTEFNFKELDKFLRGYGEVMKPVQR